MLNPVRKAKSRAEGQGQTPPVVRGEDEVNRKSWKQAEVPEVVIPATIAEALSMFQPWVTHYITSL